MKRTLVFLILFTFTSASYKTNKSDSVKLKTPIIMETQTNKYETILFYREGIGLGNSPLKQYGWNNRFNVGVGYEQLYPNTGPKNVYIKKLIWEQE